MLQQHAHLLTSPKLLGTLKSVTGTNVNLSIYAHELRKIDFRYSISIAQSARIYSSYSGQNTGTLAREIYLESTIIDLDFYAPWLEVFKNYDRNPIRVIIQGNSEGDYSLVRFDNSVRSLAAQLWDVSLTLIEVKT